MLKNIKINIFRPIIAILLVFIPLYPKFPLFNVSNTYVSIRLDDIIVAISVFIWLIYQVKNKFPVFKIKISRLFLVYFLAITISSLNAYLIYQTEPTNILILHLFRRFEYISLFFISLNSIKSISDFRFLYPFFLISTALVSFYGYGQKYLQFPIVSTMNSEFSKGQLLQMNVWTRVSSTFAGHYDLAAFMSLALIIILAVALVSRNRFIKALSFLVWLPSYQILTLTASRVSIFAFFGGAVITLLFLKKYWWILPVGALVVFSIFNSDDLNQRLIATIPALKNQFLSSQTNQPSPPAPTSAPSLVTPTAVVVPSGSIIKTTPTPTITRHQAESYPTIDADVGVARSGEIRFNAEWPRAINAWKKNLITGSGLGSITLATDNDYLRCLGESGLLGLITFASIFIFFTVKTIPIFFKKKTNVYHLISIIFFGCMLTMLANAVFIDVFEASKTAYLFWIMMALYYQSLILSNEKP